MVAPRDSAPQQPMFQGSNMVIADELRQDSLTPAVEHLTPGQKNYT